MAPRELPHEVWEVVLSMLKKPIPPPLSKVPQSEIRQGDLCNTMRTCSLFNAIASKLLYTKIVTDAFPLLVRNIPTSPALRRNLNRTTNLYIEYSPKCEEPTYQVLLQNGEKAWKKIGRTPEELQKALLRECGVELGQLWDSLGWMRENPTLLPKVFSKLETVAVASIEGKPDGRWKDYENNQRHDHAKIWQTGMAKGSFDQFLHELGTSAKLRHLCIRDASGPMSTPSITMASHVAPIFYTRTIHIPPECNEPDVAMPFGAPVRWVTDDPYSVSWQTLSTSICGALNACLNLYNQDDGRPRKKTDCADLEIYGTSPLKEEVYLDGEAFAQYAEFEDPSALEPFTIPESMSSVAEQRKDARDTSKILQDVFRENSRLKDKLKWFASADTPVCLACGSGPPLEDQEARKGKATVETGT